MTRLSEDLIKKLVAEIGKGRVSLPSLIAEFKISRASSHRWNTNGLQLIDKFGGDPDEAIRHIYENFKASDIEYAVRCVTFASEIPAAFAALRGKLEKVVIEEGLTDARMALRILERCDPPQWAKRVHIEGKMEERKTVTQIVIHGGTGGMKQLEETNPIEAEFEEI